MSCLYGPYIPPSELIKHLFFWNISSIIAGFLLSLTQPTPWPTMPKITTVALSFYFLLMQLTINSIYIFAIHICTLQLIMKSVLTLMTSQVDRGTHTNNTAKKAFLLKLFARCRRYTITLGNTTPGLTKDSNVTTPLGI